MGLRDKHQELREADDAPAEREERWEYLARNLAKVPGFTMEDDFNKLGRQGWEFCAMATGGKDGYAVFKRRVLADS